jgi:hypothetical protein
VPKDDDLDLQIAIRTRTTGPDHAAEQRVKESEQHERGMLHRRWSGRRVREDVPFSRDGKPWVVSMAWAGRQLSKLITVPLFGVGFPATYTVPLHAIRSVPVQAIAPPNREFIGEGPAAMICQLSEAGS